MRAILLIPVLTAAFALSACDQGGEAITATDNRAAPDTGVAAQVAKLDETQRNGVLEKAIHAAGVACPRVVKSERMEIATGVMGWKATCDNDSAHLIQILPDGTGKVTSRTH